MAAGRSARCRKASAASRSTRARLKPGDAFFAIKGETLDGHDFATAAIKAGAGVLVVAEGKLPALGRARRAPMIVVPDVLAGAGKGRHCGARALARRRSSRSPARPARPAPRKRCATRLSAVGKVHASDKSFNNHWGVPLTLARMPADCDYAVFEIGMNHAGEIRPLVKMVRPHVAIVTLIAAAHLGHFRNLDEIATRQGGDLRGHRAGRHGAAQSRRSALEAARQAGPRGRRRAHRRASARHARADFRLIEMRARTPIIRRSSAKIGGT